MKVEVFSRPLKTSVQIRLTPPFFDFKIFILEKILIIKQYLSIQTYFKII